MDTEYVEPDDMWEGVTFPDQVSASEIRDVLQELNGGNDLLAKSDLGPRQVRFLMVIIVFQKRYPELKLEQLIEPFLMARISLNRKGRVEAADILSGRLNLKTADEKLGPPTENRF